MKKKNIYVYNVDLDEMNKVSNISGKTDKFLKYYIFMIFVSQNPCFKKTIQNN